MTHLLACAACFGAQETSTIDGTRVGVLVMLAILLAVQGGFVGFFLYLYKRAKRVADMSSIPNRPSSRRRREHHD